MIPGCKANIRDKNQQGFGIVTDYYKVVQNSEAFAFMDALLEKGVNKLSSGRFYF